MSRWKLMPIVLLLIPVQASVSWGQKSKEASTPEEAVKYLEEAAKSGDLEGVFAQFAKPMRSMFQMMLEMEKEQNAFQDALDEKFGKDLKAPPRRGMKEQIKDTKSMEIAEKTDKGNGLLLLKLKITSVRDGKDRSETESVIALKEGKAWKLAFMPGNTEVGPDFLKKMEEEVQKEKAQAAKRKAAIEKVTKDVKAGKFKNRQEAQTALFDAQFDAPKKPAPPPGKEDKK